MNNRNRGHNFERDVRQDLIKTGFINCQTSRYASRALDDAKVDMANCGEWLFQTKTINGRVKYEDILSVMPESGLRVVLHRMTHKKGNKFMEKGKYAIMRYEDLMNILHTLNLHKIEHIEQLF